MDANMITTLGAAVGVLVGVYAIVKRVEDRLGKRIDDAKEILRADVIESDLKAFFKDRR